MTPEELRVLLTTVARALARVGELPDEAEAGPPAGPLFRPAERRSPGAIADWVTPVASRWAPSLDLVPSQLAGILAQALMEKQPIASVEVAPSGLLAITLTDSARAEIIQVVLDHPDTYALPTDEFPLVLPEHIPGAATTESIAAGQHAYARLQRLIRNAIAGGVEIRPTDRRDELTEPVEKALLVAVADEPQRLATHLGDPGQQQGSIRVLAELANDWTAPIRPMGASEKPTSIHGARLALAEAAAIVLRNGLAVVGATAPDKI